VVRRVAELQFLRKINSSLIEDDVRAAEPFSMSLKAVISSVVVNGLIWAGSSLAGSPRNADVVGPGPVTSSRVGQLIVYTATHEFEDGHDTWAYPHTSYFIYRPDGFRYKYVPNHITRSDSQPDTVDLPSGQYYIVAQADFAPRVRVPVKIMPGRTTIVNLEHGIATD
jgi:hypothetical protein